MPATIQRRRRARTAAGVRSHTRTTPSTPAAWPLFLLLGKDASGRIVARDCADSPSRADCIAGTWRECGLVVAIGYPPRKTKASSPGR
jgi:hypothetical protein